ncbi:hypothetical protein UA08_00500 [Talaromyces atroroseus]|uniref:Transporter n=1 Tax=Talaromyces atroroseus TaxID=1441469 RepID=A0A225APU1_TALAT|nr:hypothetical protein UA08_00500 [Talaromyces atroroseus]OKL63641.1 hypothetical protein UA08_00500 [Talaromyces atroroseus]
MADANKGLVQPFLGALQACISVLLTLLYGVVTRQANLIHESSINEMSGICVKIFLPALTLVKLGSELHLAIAVNYLPVFIWSILYTVISIAIGRAFTYLLRLPQWVTPAVTFNNTSSLPLLLLQTLHSTGSLKLILSPGQTEQDALNRAQSYFLVCAVVSNTIGYALGPRMLSDKGRGDRKHDDEEDQQNVPPENLAVTSEAQQQFRHDIQNGQPDHSETEGGDQQPDEEELDERTSLLPNPAQKARHSINNTAHHIFRFFPRRLRRGIDAIDSPFLDVIFICTATGVLLGLVPKLHRAFFAPYEQGGIFNAWFVTSIQNLGTLFTSLQVFLVGCKLGVGFERMKRSGDSGQVPIRAVLVVFFVRLVLWPVISILALYYFIRLVGIFPNDPVLWFIMMMLPTGPPALLISGLAELSSEVTKSEKIAIARMLAIMYGLSPLICLTVTGALKATEAIRSLKS